MVEVVMVHREKHGSVLGAKRNWMRHGPVKLRVVPKSDWVGLIMQVVVRDRIAESMVWQW
jgi:hypothetical protein